MEPLRKLEQIVGGRWTGIRFHAGEIPQTWLARTPMRLCQAVRESSTGPITLIPERTNCPGALRSLGWGGRDDRISSQIAAMAGTSSQTAERLVSQTPRLNSGDVTAVTVGLYEDPDVVVSYVQPLAAMKLIRQWQMVNGAKLAFDVSTVMAVCGNVVVNAQQTGQICLSFGCPDSRQYGEIGNDRLIVGFPFAWLQKFLDAVSETDHKD